MDPKQFVKEYSIRSLVCCFSGGKDSLVATHHVMSELEDFDIDKQVVFVDTGVMLPIAEPYVKDVSARYGWKLNVLHGNFFEHARKNGMPRPKHRWCCYTCKLKPMIEFVSKLKPQRAEVTGLRHDESPRRAKLPQILFKKRAWSWGYAPIIEWKEKDVLHYIRAHGLPMPPNYRLGLKETCMCGVYSTSKQMRILRAQFPELWQKFVDLEAGFRTHGAAFYFRSKPVRTKDIAAQKNLEEV